MIHKTHIIQIQCILFDNYFKLIAKHEVSGDNLLADLKVPSRDFVLCSLLEIFELL